MSTRVGAISEVWRYPVKSMLGERIERASVGPLGLDGDRAFAVCDQDSGRVISAKRLASLFSGSAHTRDGTTLVTLPHSSPRDALDPWVADHLSQLLGRAVTIATRGSIPEPLIESSDKGSTDEGSLSEFEGMVGTFFDAAPVHILTTASLRGISALDPDSTYDVRRFRPNVLLDVAGDDFIEQQWVGRTVLLGEVELRVSGPCGRCVMTTHAQSELPTERAVLRTVARSVDNNLGVLCSVAWGGQLSAGDDVRVR